MVRRALCIYEGETIGIERIYTICNGKPIYIPGEVEQLRELGRQNKLFCPCGCGSNVGLVAGDKMLRYPHFRSKRGTERKNCVALEESEVSIWSKIMLKCWLDSKLKSPRVESLVPLNKICASERKFEFTFYDFESKLGICYWNERANITSDKVNIIEELNNVNRTLYIADIHNSGTVGQYPEFMIKVQNKQGYNLFLDINILQKGKAIYDEAILDTRVYVQDRYKMWCELKVVSDKLDNYALSSEGELLYENVCVGQLAKQAVNEFEREEKKRLEQEQERIAEQKKKDEERKKQIKASVTTRILAQKENEKSSTRIVQGYLEKKKFTEDGQEIETLDFQNYDKRVIDMNGNRWIQCKVCKRKSLESYFVEKDIDGESNSGVCFNCSDKKQYRTRPQKNNQIKAEIAQEKICPRCGAKLAVRFGRRGKFLGCSNYPQCTHTEDIQ